ncbi:MAG: hypothetical protein ACI965_000468 [Paraglaciecola sp.]|jgi:hypothetical protein
MRRLITFSFIFASVLSQAASWQISYPRPLLESDLRTAYPVKLLSLALDQTGVNYRLSPSDKLFSQGKALKELAANREINVLWTATNTQREEQLLPIRIPIFKGLIGWRVLLIRDDMSDRFKYIQKSENLIKLIGVQGHDWPDTKILQANGFEVATANNYASLFDMLRKAQADFFPRSLVEVWGELANPVFSKRLILEPNIVIKYPAAMYFFVNKKSVPLANLLETGLEMAIANGKFDELFLQVHQEMLNKSNIKERRFFDMKNTFLPETTPLERKELWYQP